MNKKILFCIVGGIVIIAIFSFTKYAMALVPDMFLDHQQNGQNVTFFVSATLDTSKGCGGSLVGETNQIHKLIIHYGDGNSESFLCKTVFDNADKMHKCLNGISHFYSNSGTYTIKTSARYVSCNDTWTTVFDSVVIIAPVCVSDGCNGICPAGCTVAEDPDCGCLDGDGCCGIGCDDASDNDCAAGVSRYRNPLIWNEIIAFIWGAIISIFSQSIVLAVLMILVGAYVITTSGGNITKVQLGRRIIIWTIIGYAVMLLARGIIMFIIRFPSS